MRSDKIALAVGVCALLLCAPLSGEDETKKQPEKQTDKPQPTEVTTSGAVDVHGQHILYNAIAGTITVGATHDQDAQIGLDGKPLPGSELALTEPKDAKDAPPTAKMFYVAYMKKDAKAEERPITFFYNGGPGSASLWLHMGSLGPKHVVTSGDEHLPAAPYKMVDNTESLLDASDVVFIDMPGTGFGRLMGKDPQKEFWGVQGDAEAFARFIVRFITKYDRWNSPKYLFGESYGTTRSAVLTNILQNEYSLDLNGVILLSQIFNFTVDIDAAQENPGVDLPYVLGLPTYAATSWYHHKLPNQPAALEPFLREVETYALGPYTTALAKGTDLSDTEKQQVAAKLHEYTGLPVAYWLKANLRVNGGEFEQTLLADENLTTGRLDTRFSGPTIDALSENAEYDPQSSAISSAYVSLFNDYARKELKYGEGQTYLDSALFNGHHWDWKMQGRMITNVSEPLAGAMSMNPRLRVLVLGGYYDLATPYFAAHYEDKHLPISANLAKNIEYKWFESGHMVYVRDECIKQLHDRVAEFIESTGKSSR